MKAGTVASCNFKYERFLADAIASARTQDDRASRVPVIDDGSTGSPSNVIERIDSRVTLAFKNNRGQLSAYSRALELLDSECGIFLDADGVLYPIAASEVVHVFESGECVNVRFGLDVLAAHRKRTGNTIPHSNPPTDCASLQRRGGLYSSQPASGNAYRVSALRRRSENNE